MQRVLYVAINFHAIQLLIYTNQRALNCDWST